MKKAVENVYAAALNSTFRVINPVKKSLITTDCIVHLFIQQTGLDILKKYGYDNEHSLFIEYIDYINEGLVWADQDFKSYHHFYNPKEQKGKFGYDENAMTVGRRYYNNALKYWAMENYEKSMFYFGAACHIIQDLTVPQHAKGKLFDNHRQFEVYVKNNYRKIKKFKSNAKPVIFDFIVDYIDYNAGNALRIDLMYQDIDDLNTKFYLTALKCLTLAQRTTAGCMITFYKDLWFS